MKRIHIQHQYMKWAKNRVLPNPGDAHEKAGRFLYHLFRTGEINQDERFAWRGPLAKDIERLGWAKFDDTQSVNSALKAFDKLLAEAQQLEW